MRCLLSHYIRRQNGLEIVPGIKTVNNLARPSAASLCTTNVVLLNYLDHSEHADFKTIECNGDLPTITFSHLRNGHRVGEENRPMHKRICLSALLIFWSTLAWGADATGFTITKPCGLASFGPGVTD